MSAKQRKAQRPPDWHKADIVCALHKAGWSLRRLSLHHGYKVGTVLHTALHRPYPKGERLIAAAIGVDPADIWPSRYQDSTTRTRRVRRS